MEFARRWRGPCNAQALVVGKITGGHYKESVRSYAKLSDCFATIIHGTRLIEDVKIRETSYMNLPSGAIFSLPFWFYFQFDQFSIDFEKRN